MASGRQGGEWLVDLENSWCFHRNNAGYRCVQHRICPVRVRLLQGLYIVSGEHTHANQWQEIINARFENEIKDLVRVRPGPIRTTLDELRGRSHPLATTNYNSMYATLLRIRNRSQPLIPRTIEALDALLLEQRFTGRFIYCVIKNHNSICFLFKQRAEGLFSIYLSIFLLLLSFYFPALNF